MDPLEHIPSAEKIGILVEGLDHSEGVAWDPGEQVVYAGGEAGQIYRINPAHPAPETIANVGGLVLGITVDGAGRIIACVPGIGAVCVVDEQRAVHRFIDVAGGRPLVTPNYSAFGPDGTLYFTDAGDWEKHNGRVVSVSPSGEVAVFSDALNRFPNGCAVSPDGRWLWVIESLGPTVNRFDLHNGGEPEIMLRLHGHVPDGLAFTTSGGVLISCYRPDRIYYLDSAGRLSVVGQDPHGTILAAPTNVCFIGSELDMLVSANLGRWHLTWLQVDLQGVPLFRPPEWGFDCQLD